MAMSTDYLRIINPVATRLQLQNPFVYVNVVASQWLQVLDISNASMTGQIPALWFDLSASTAAASASLSSMLSNMMSLASRVNLSAKDDSNSGALMPDTVSVQQPEQAASAAVGPKAVVGLSDLQVLRLGCNQLSGDFPEQIGALAKLKVLDLSRNALGGNLTVQLATLSQLQASGCH